KAGCSTFLQWSQLQGIISLTFNLLKSLWISLIDFLIANRNSLLFCPASSMVNLFSKYFSFMIAVVLSYCKSTPCRQYLSSKISLLSFTISRAKIPFGINLYLNSNFKLLGADSQSWSISSTGSNLGIRYSPLLSSKHKSNLRFFINDRSSLILNLYSSLAQILFKSVFVNRPFCSSTILSSSIL